MIVLDSLVNVLDTVLYLFQLSLVIYIVISLLIQFGIVNPYSSIISLVQNSLSQIHEPILNIVRRYIPMFGNLDLSPLVVFLLIMFLSDILNKITWSYLYILDKKLYQFLFENTNTGLPKSAASTPTVPAMVTTKLEFLIKL